MDPHSAPSPVDLVEVWEQLATGRARVAASFFHDAHCGLLLQPSAAAEGGVFGRQRVIVESVLRGVCQNCLAIDLNIASSTVALHAKDGFKRLGVGARPSRVPSTLMLIASVAGCPGASAPSMIVPSNPDGAFMVRVPRADLSMLGLLSPAEHCIVSLLFEGHSYADIARRRGTSSRTIANQVASAFRRFAVSGRSQLIRQAFVLSGWLPKSELPSRVIARAS
jgi:DNA-binding NarL/FixJ family response regulator